MHVKHKPFPESNTVENLRVDYPEALARVEAIMQKHALPLFGANDTLSRTFVFPPAIGTHYTLEHINDYSDDEILAWIKQALIRSLDF